VAVFIEKATLEWPQKFGIEVELPREMVEGDRDRDREERAAQLRLEGESEKVKVNLLAYLVEKWANITLEEARAEIGRFYPTETSEGLVGTREITEDEGWEPVTYLWARTIICQNPSCGAEIPLIRQFWLVRKPNKRIAYRPIVDQKRKKVEFEILEGQELEAAGFDPRIGIISQSDVRCPVCEQVTKGDNLRKLARASEVSHKKLYYNHQDMQAF
jgi:putative DNA methylase